jgi:hypothetical protein
MRRGACFALESKDDVGAIAQSRQEELDGAEPVQLTIAGPAGRVVSDGRAPHAHPWVTLGGWPRTREVRAKAMKAANLDAIVLMRGREIVRNAGPPARSAPRSLGSGRRTDRARRG